jgi:WD40 repeat protein
VGLEDGRTRIVKIDSAKTERTLPSFADQDGVTAVAFARDGTLATGMNSGVVRLWNPSTGEEIGHPTQVAAAPVASISFHPDGETFATAGGSDGVVKIWTTQTQQQFGDAFPGPPGLWGHAQFVGSGNRLVVVYGGGEAFVWPTSLAAWKQHACAVAGRNLTREEWARFVGNRPYTNVCALPH